MFRYVVISWMIEMKEQINFVLDEHYGGLCIGGPQFNDKFCHNLHGTLFEEFFVTAVEDIYDIMCGLYT